MFFIVSRSPILIFFLSSPAFDVINDLCPPEVSSIFENWIVPQVVDFRKLSPFQFPPQSIKKNGPF